MARRQDKALSLIAKIIIIVLVVGIVYISTDYVIHRFLVFPNFITLERNEARKDAGRAIAAIQRELYHLDKFTTDWAYWDDAYLFINDKNSEFIDSNLSAISVFLENKLNVICFIDLNGDVVWGKTFNLERDGRLETLDSAGVFKIRSLIHGPDADKSNPGLLLTKYGAFFICYAPILTSDLKGPANGTLIMGRMINEDVIQTLSEQTKLDLTLWNLGDNTIPSAERAIFSKIHQGKKQIIAIEPVNDALLKCYTVLYDLTSQPALLARISIPRDIANQGKKAVFVATLSIFVAGTLFIVLLLFFLHINVSKPIAMLTENVIQVNKGGELVPFPTSYRTDEIGILTHEFNALIEKLDHEIVGHKKTINDLEIAFSEIKTLRGLIPICAHCKKIRDDNGLWNRIEAYISQHSEASFSHGICPECIKKHYLKDRKGFDSKKD